MAPTGEVIFSTTTTGTLANAFLVSVDANGGFISLVGGGQSELFAAGDYGANLDLRCTANGFGIAFGRDAASIYFAIADLSVILKFGSDGFVSVVAGNLPGSNTSCAGPNTGGAGFCGDDGPATFALLNAAEDVDVAPDSSLFIADTNNHCIRRIDVEGTISLVAGTPTVAGFSGDGGDATSALLNRPRGVVVTESGRELFLTDSENCAVRRVDLTSGVISTVAGIGQQCGFSGDNGLATSARLSNVQGIDIDKFMTLFIADTDNHVIRRVRLLPGGDSTTGIIASVVGTGEDLSPYVGDGGPAENATLSFPSDVMANSDGSLFISDTNNNVIRKVDPRGTISTFAGGIGAAATGSGGPAVNATLNQPAGLSLDSDNNLYIADRENDVIRKVLSNGTMINLVGSGKRGMRGDGGPATQVELNLPSDVSVSDAGAVFIADTGNHAIRQLLQNGSVVTICGTLGVSGFGGDGGLAINALLNSPMGVAARGERAVVFSDTKNCVVREIDLLSGIVETLAGVGEMCGQRPLLLGPRHVSLLNERIFFADVSPLGDDSLIYSLSDEQGVLGYSSCWGSCAFALDTINGSTIDYYIDTLTITDGRTFPKVHRFVEDLGMGYFAILDSVTLEFRDVSGEYPDDDEIVKGLSPFRDVSAIAVARGSRDQTIFISDSANNVIWLLGHSPVERDDNNCPAGFACECPLALKPCTLAGTFCPAGTAQALPVNEGYVTLFRVVPGFADNVPLSYSQAPCPIGSFCSSGVAYACPSGSYSSRLRQTSPLSCTQCELGFYLADRGTAIPFGGLSPCLPCRTGSYSDARGSGACIICAPGFFQRSAGSQQPCAPCPPGTSSLHGAAACFTILAGDGLVTVSGAAAFQRVSRVETGNVEGAALLQLLLGTSLPILALASLPLLFLLAANSSTRFRRTTVLLGSALAYLDQYSLAEIPAKGASPVNVPSATGGAFSILVAGSIVALMAATTAQYNSSNVVLVTSVLPVFLSTISAYVVLPFAQSAAAFTAAGLNVGATGLIVSVDVMGAQCGVLLGNASTAGLLANVSNVASFVDFAYSVTTDKVSGASRHVFSCPACIPNAFSSLQLAFHPSCQSFVVTLAAVGVGGGVTASSAVANDINGRPFTSATLTFPVALEVIQDTIGGFLDANGVYVDGRSSLGLSSTGVSGNELDLVSQDDAALEATRLELNFFLAADFTRFTLSARMTQLSFASSLAAFLPLFGAGALVLTCLRFIKRACRRGGGAKMKTASSSSQEDDGLELATRAHAADATTSTVSNPVAGSSFGHQLATFSRDFTATWK